MYTKKILLPLFVLVFINSFCRAQVVINEISANNVSEILSPTGDYDDWIELYNMGSSAVDLTGYGITDNAAHPHKFKIKSGSIAPGGFKLIFANGHNFDEEINHWEKAIDYNDSWRYFVGNTQPDTNWRNLSFNDQNWSLGTGGIGFGDGDDNTTIPLTNALFMRKKFNVTDSANILSAILNIDYDDGFVAYLNGVEIARSNLGSPKSRPGKDVSATLGREAAMFSGGDPEYYFVDPKLLRHILVQGNNVLAVQVHNQSPTSNDLSSLVFFEVGVKSSAQTFGTVRSWFDGTRFTTYQASFKLDRQGEEIFLFDSAGNMLDQQSFTDMQVDNSGGRKPNGGGWCTFSNPSPGTSNNNATCYSGVCPVPVFSNPAGFYTSTFTLHATTTLSGAKIRYTTDGSDPTASSTVFPANGLSISSTKTIKARVYATGYLPSPIVNNTYFKNQSAHLPSFCINTTPAYLFDPVTGMYEMGPNADTVSPYFGANFWQDWQKPAMIEYFDRGHSQKFQVNANISMFGNYSRAKPQKSFEIRVDKNKGTGAIDYPLLPDKPYLPPFDDFVLRNAGTEWNKVHFRDAFLERLMKNTYSGYLAAEPVNVFINGAYWGVYCTYENHDQHFFENNYGFKRDEVDYLLQNSNVKPKLGSTYDFTSLVSYATGTNPSSSNYYNTIDAQLDLKNFTDFFIAETYFDNEDWMGDWTNNMKMWRPEGGKWKYVLYDLDYTTNYGGTSASTNTLQVARNPNAQNSSSDLFDAVLENPTYKSYFINRYADLINTIFQLDSVKKVEKSFKDSMQYDMPQHFAKWGSSVSSWNSNINGMLNFFDDRTVQMRNFIENEFNMHSQVDLTLKVSPAGSGRIQISTIEPGPLPWTGVYYNGNPVRITAIPNPGYTFDHWRSTNAITSNNTNQSVSMNFSADDIITAYFTGTALSPSVVISEINYNSDSAFNTGDWIEIHNMANFNLDISGWSIKDSNDYHQYVFPVNTVLPANGYLVVTEDNTKFSSLNPGVNNFMGPLGFNISNSGDRLRLFDNNSNSLIDMTFDDKAPWAESPDGDGFTLELLNASTGLSNSASWFAGCYGGSPGHAYSAPAAQISTPSSSYICADSTMQLNALTNPSYTYQWRKNNTVIPGATLNNLTVSSAGAYTVVIQSQGCAVVSNAVSINQYPHAATPVVHDYSLCDTGHVLMSATDTAVVHWFNSSTGGTPLATGQSYTTPFLNHSVTYYADAGSVCPSARAAIHVDVHSSPVINLGNDTLVASGSPVTLNAGAGYSSYLWSNNSTSQTYTVISPSTVWVHVTDANGCTGIDTIDISIPNGINNSANSTGISFYPNPVKSNLNYSFINNQDKPILIQLIDTEGRILEENVIKNKGLVNGEFEMSNYSKGVYIVSVSGETERKQFKIVLN